MIKFFEWLGTFTSIIGSFVIAFGYMGIGYSFFLVGSFAWLTVGFMQHNRPLITLNATFFLANVIGLVRAVL